MPHGLVARTRFLGLNRGRSDCKKALCAATKCMIGVVVIVALITGILFTVLGKSDVPVTDFEVRAMTTDWGGLFLVTTVLRKV